MNNKYTITKATWSPKTIRIVSLLIISINLIVCFLFSLLLLYTIIFIDIIELRILSTIFFILLVYVFKFIKFNGKKIYEIVVYEDHIIINYFYGNLIFESIKLFKTNIRIQYTQLTIPKMSYNKIVIINENEEFAIISGYGLGWTKNDVQYVYKTFKEYKYIVKKN